ncbi:MAG: MarR family transcriptional regulator [Cyanobacteria bacterium RUI128]|nr:MarR family transcriptional regulator [Cyanobacteria bacterium RUI128]
MNTKTTKQNLAEGFIDSLYYQIKLTEKCSKMLAKQLEESMNLEITLDELTALATINMHNGEIHQRDLAKILLKDRPNTGRLLNNLENNGYVKRVSKTKNKRQAHIINLTKKGEETLSKLTDIIRTMFDNVHNNMTHDIKYLKEGLIELRELMKAEIDIHI